MSGEIYMAAVGALAYEKRMQIISNNLANSNTVGYKQDHGRFRIIDLSALPEGSTQDGVPLNPAHYTDHTS
jgi:flagellar basal body rod protein FlgG